MVRFRPAVLALAALALPAAVASAQSRPPREPTGWAQATSDLPADPAIRFGVLPNGVRYALMHDATPAGQTSLRLRIGSGSLEETDAERGLAHVLEHMAFKGSVHAPDGQMVKVLQRLGLSFGGDTNARTGWTDTVYQLDLPESDPATLETGLTLLADVGSGLLIKPEALATERGVVLSEERLRDTPDYEVQKARLAFALKGQLAPERQPIGLVPVVQNAPAATVRGFYAANYRPERAVLVAVGDFDVDAMQAEVARLFGGWRAAAPARPAPDLGAPAPRGAATQLIVRKGAAPSLALSWVRPRDDTPDSVAKERRDFVEGIALSALNRRLSRLAHAPDAPFLAAQIGQGNELDSAHLVQLQALYRPPGWRAALDAVVGAERSALAYGLTPAEVAREVTEAGVQFRTAAAGAATRRSATVAEEVVRTVDEHQVDTSPAEDLALYDQFSRGLTPAEVDAALHRVLESGSGPLVSLSAPDGIDGGEGALAAALRQAQARPPAPPAVQAAPRWTHTDFGAPGRVVQTRRVADLGVTVARFANGVTLLVKPTAFRKDQVLVGVNFGQGRLGLPTDRVSADWAGSALVSGGLDDLTYEDVQQALADRTTSVALSTGDDAFSLTGATRPQDLDVQLQLMAAYMTRPGWRPEAFARVQDMTAVGLAQLPATPQGVQARDLPALEHGGDPRWAYPTQAQVRATRLADLQAILAPALARGPVEVVIAGDVTVEAAERAVAATLGALPARPALPAPSPAALQVRFPSGDGGAGPVVRDHHGRPDQAVAYVGWAGVDLLSDPQRARRLNMAAEVLQLRLVDRLRVAEGATYSPAAGASPSDTFPGYGYLYAAVEVPPARIPGFYADVARIAADLRERAPSADELQRAVKPRVETIARAQQTNGYWLTMLHDAAADPRRLELIRGSIPGYQRLTAADVQGAAGRYLDGAGWRFEVLPASAASH